jgi:hypothetical protein
MGHLIYDSNTRVSFDDRVLAHLEVVIISKLRRRESFSMSWREDPATGGGRNTVWFDVALPLRFHFDGSRPMSIDRSWLERLSAAASSSAGLIVVDEFGEPVMGSIRERGF